MSFGKYLIFTLIYWERCIGEARKQFVILADMNSALYPASDIVLLSRILVASRLATGEPVSSKQVKRSPPTEIRTLRAFFFSGFTSQTKVAYVTSLPGGTSPLGMNLMVRVS